MGSRMTQRGITSEVVDTVRQFGVEKGDKVILNSSGCAAAIQALEKLKRQLVHIAEKGGYVVVECGDHLITTYRLDSYHRVGA
jgi:hypothetical protein